MKVLTPAGKYFTQVRVSAMYSHNVLECCTSCDIKLTRCDQDTVIEIFTLLYNFHYHV